MLLSYNEFHRPNQVYYLSLLGAGRTHDAFGGTMGCNAIFRRIPGDGGAANPRPYGRLIANRTSRVANSVFVWLWQGLQSGGQGRPRGLAQSGPESCAQWR